MTQYEVDADCRERHKLYKLLSDAGWFNGEGDYD